jgi:hypothetical protein
MFAHPGSGCSGKKKVEETEVKRGQRDVIAEGVGACLQTPYDYAGTRAAR